MYIKKASYISNSNVEVGTPQQAFLCVTDLPLVKSYISLIRSVDTSLSGSPLSPPVSDL